MTYNVPSVSEVPQRGIWAIAEARYALLYAVPLLERLNLLSQEFEVFKET